VKLRLFADALDDVAGVCHVGADRARKTITIDAWKVDARIGQRFGRRLPAERNVFELAWKLPFDINLRTEHQAVWNAWHAREATNTRLATLHRLPDPLTRMADGRDHSDAGDDYTTVVRRAVRHVR
jgi:hypothetical protein